jgi:hypothetical protein
MGAEITGPRKNVLDHLGRSRQSFETLLSLGTAVSEVFSIATFMETTEHSFLTVESHRKGSSRVCQRRLQCGSIDTCIAS